MCSCLSSTGIQSPFLPFRILPDAVVHAQSPDPWNVSLWGDCQALWLSRRSRFPTALLRSISLTGVSKTESLERCWQWWQWCLEWLIHMGLETSWELLETDRKTLSQATCIGLLVSTSTMSSSLFCSIWGQRGDSRYFLPVCPLFLMFHFHPFHRILTIWQGVLQEWLHPFPTRTYGLLRLLFGNAMGPSNWCPLLPFCKLQCSAFWHWS